MPWEIIEKPSGESEGKMKVWMCTSPVRHFTVGKLYQQALWSTAPEHILMCERTDNGRPYWAKKNHFREMELV
jgi:hypothetical protein